MNRIFGLLVILNICCMNAKPVLIYADGSANRYEISATALKYVPVKPEESSTGLYSGGKPVQVVISSEQYTRVKDLFEAALAQTDQHIPNRMKTSGLVIIENGSERVEAILKPGSSSMIGIEAELKRLAEKK